jgi:hypothetical protein
MPCRVGLERSNDEKLLPAKFCAFCSELPVKFRKVFREFPAYMQKRRIRVSKPQKALDTYSEKRGRGRPGVRPSEIRGRADNYRMIFGYVWDRLRKPLLTAKSEIEVIKVFEENAQPYTREFMPMLAGLVFKVIRERKFPKRKEARINFLADSLAGYGSISARRSRDICEKERKKKVHQLIREEFYIVCSCGYKGPALRGACPKFHPKEIFIPFPRIYS